MPEANKTHYIYRIIHRDNLYSILKKGKIFAPNFSKDKNYISIGETELIEHRSELTIPIKPFGNIKDYVAFYFGVRSPMLYCIKKGFDVKKRDQSEIIYLISSIEKINELNKKFVFTDGHAYASFTQFYNEESKLDNIDWKAVKLIRWNNTNDDPDRKRRKQAECFIHKFIEVKGLLGVAVYNKECYNYIQQTLKDTSSSNIKLIIKSNWYY